MRREGRNVGEGGDERGKSSPSGGGRLQDGTPTGDASSQAQAQATERTFNILPRVLPSPNGLSLRLDPIRDARQTRTKPKINRKLRVPIASKREGGGRTLSWSSIWFEMR